ncbi:MAG: chemotaxis protein CheX [Deltaproteobacteria bacterium]|nr:chemotaxis protein CheX [Deltaproteobacteria bacterium]
MQAELINPFIKSTINVLSTMCAINPTPGKPSLKGDKKTWGIVTGIIGLAGPSVMGNMMISFDTDGVLKVVGNLLSEQYTEITQDVIDAVGEITNMITGGAKKDLSEIGMMIEMATPMVMIGSGVEISQLASAPILTVPFSFQEGAFVVEASLSQRK